MTAQAPPRVAVRRRTVRYLVLSLLGVLALGGSVAMFSATVPGHRSGAGPAGRLLWQESYDSGNLARFEKTDALPESPAVVASPVADGRYAGRYAVPPGGQRCETVPAMRAFSEGDDLWFSWSTRLSDGFPVDADTWQVITQWKNEGVGSPPVELKVNRGEYLLDGGSGWPGDTEDPSPRYGSVSLGPARAGVWVHWLVHMKFSANPGEGFVSLWRDGAPEVSHWHPPGGTLYPNLSSYLKIGYYRDSGLAVDAAVYHDSWKVGTARRAVS